MENNYTHKTVVIKDVMQETATVKFLTLAFKDKKDYKNFDFAPGQFFQIYISGVGESPLTIASSPRNKKTFQVGFRKVGAVTSRLWEVKKGDEFGIRGPFGKPLPSFDEMKKRNVLLIAGGCGIFTFKPVLDYISEEGNWPTRVQLCYGAKTFEDVLLKSYHEIWKKIVGFTCILSEPEADWKGKRGFLVETIMPEIVIGGGMAILCGPPVMYKGIIENLKKMGYSDKDIYLSLERRMHCAQGVCQHCAVGPKYVCKDGPTFTWEEIKDYPEAM